MTLSLRPHHLLCILTFAGKGYSPAFTVNFARIVRRLADGETIRIVDGPDDVCVPMLREDDPHCLNDTVTVRDEAALSGISALLEHPIKAGSELTLSPDLLSKLRGAFAKGGIRTACDGCEWEGLCSDIAADKYRVASLMQVRNA